VEPGPHRLQIRADGFAPSPYREIVVPDGGDADLGAVRLLRGGILVGRVIDFEGRPVAGVRVAVRGEFLFTDTDENGRFRLECVPVGSHVLVVNGLESPTFPAAAVEGRETKLELEIPR